MANPVQAAVDIATAEELLNGLNSASGQLPTETVEEWLARQEFERVVDASTPGASSPLYKWDYSAADEFDRVVRETTAEGAWQNWGGQPTPQGSAAPPPSTQASPQVPIKEAGAAGATVGGLLSVSLPTWVAAAAPLLGVGVGVGLYELAPEFWTKVSQALLPWCYEDTQVMPVVVDKDGNTYIDKEAVEELKKVFDESGITGKKRGTATNPAYPGTTLKFNPAWPGAAADTSVSKKGGYGLVSTNADFYYTSSANPVWLVSTSPITLTYRDYANERDITVTFTSSITVGGATYYFGRTAFSSDPDAANIQELSTSGITVTDAIRIFYGEDSTIDYAPNPEGIDEWKGTSVDIADLPITEVYTDPTGSDTRDFIPVALPTNPGQSVDAETNPDPTKNEDPEAQISPYINPSIGRDQYPSGSDSTGEDGQKLDDSAPIPLPYPPTQSQPNPDDNPSDKDDTPPQRFVDIIPPIDSGNIDLSPIPSFGTPTDGGVGGLVSIYNPTYSELQSFSQWLWVTYQDATIDKIWNNPFDGIISLYEIYCTPSKGARKYIKSGFLVSPVECITLPQRYVEINCGTAVFPEYYGNYLDYSPYSKALVYLPFIGITELNVDDIVGHAVNITYRVDVYTGGCIAILTCAREGSNVAMYQFSGNCSVQLPIAGGTQASIRAAQISAGAYQNAYHTAGLAGLAGGLTSAFFGGANFITGPTSGFSSYASNEAFGQAAATSQTVSAKSSVQHSGQFGESYGAMGHKKPYMIIKRPVQVIVPGYQQVYGFQAHKMVQIGACTGFLRCRAVHVVSAQASDDEKSLIEKLLVSGVYVTEE